MVASHPLQLHNFQLKLLLHTISIDSDFLTGYDPEKCILDNKLCKLDS